MKKSINSCRRDKKEVEKVTSDKSDEETDVDEDGEIFVKNLNGITLQYLEACGLPESYMTFYDECKSSGMQIPSNFKAEIERGISLQDVETLMMHFDEENGDALLELWDVLTNMVDVSQHSQEVEQITFYIQVYIALIPFRLKLSQEKKNTCMQKLREFFQTKTETCTTDKEMLNLFALPFVTDPENHPVFGNLFTASWIKKLRTRIKTLARALCSPNKLTTRENTDLAKMFSMWSNAVSHEIETSDGKKICVLSNVKPIRFTSGVDIKKPKSGKSTSDDFSPSQVLQRLHDAVVENERYKAEESNYEKKFAQILDVCLLLAQGLEEAAQGKEVNMEKLRYEANKSLPPSLQKQYMVGKKVPVERASPKENAYYESCYESDASNDNQNLLNGHEEDDEDADGQSEVKTEKQS